MVMSDSRFDSRAKYSPARCASSSKPVSDAGFPYSHFIVVVKHSKVSPLRNLKGALYLRAEFVACLDSPHILLMGLHVLYLPDADDESRAASRARALSARDSLSDTAPPTTCSFLRVLNCFNTFALPTVSSTARLGRASMRSSSSRSVNLYMISNISILMPCWRAYSCATASTPTLNPMTVAGAVPVSAAFTSFSEIVPMPERTMRTAECSSPSLTASCSMASERAGGIRANDDGHRKISDASGALPATKACVAGLARGGSAARAASESRLLPYARNDSPTSAVRQIR